MRARIALNEKEIPFDVQEEDLKNFSQELRSLHPEVKVPVLVHGSRVVYESAIITEYVDELFPTKNPLMPIDPGERSEVRLWTYWCNSQFKPDLDHFKYGTSRFPAEDCVGADEKVKRHLTQLEERLKMSPWLVGEHFSLADINVFPFVRQLSRIRPEPNFFGNFQSVGKWLQTISERPSVIKALQK